MDTPRTSRTTTASQTPRTARTPGKTPTTARPPASSGTHTPRTPGPTDAAAPHRTSVFARLTTGIPPSAANRYVAVRAPAKVSWTQPSQKRRATVPTLGSVPQSSSAPHEAVTSDVPQPPHTARPSQPLYTTPLPAIHYSRSSASGKVQASSLHISREAMRVRGEPDRAVGSAQDVPRQASPDPTPPTPPETQTKPAHTTTAAPTIASPPPPLSPSSTTPVVAPEHDSLVRHPPSQSGSPVKVVRKTPPPSKRAVTSSTSATPATTQSNRVPATTPTEAGPPPVTQASPSPAGTLRDSGDESASLSDGSLRLSASSPSRSPLLFYVESNGSSRSVRSLSILPPPHQESTVVVTPLTYQLYRLLDSDGDGSVSADDLFSFIFLHAEAVLSVTAAQLNRLLDCSLSPHADDTASIVSSWRLPPSMTSVEDAVSALLLLAAHTDHGATVRPDWLEDCLESFLATPATITTPIPQPDDGTKPVADRIGQPSRRDTRAARRSRRASTAITSSSLAALDLITGDNHQTDAAGPKSPLLDASHESVMTLSVGSWSIGSTRALLRSIQFREIAPVPALLTAEALQVLTEAAFAASTPTKDLSTRREALVKSVCARLAQCEGSDDGVRRMLTELAAQLAGPLLVHAFVSQLQQFRAAQVRTRSAARPLANPLRAVAWRLAAAVPPDAREGVTVRGRILTDCGDAALNAVVRLSRRRFDVSAGHPPLPLPPHTVSLRLPSTGPVEAIVDSAEAHSATIPTTATSCAGVPRFTALAKRVESALIGDVVSCVPYVCVFRSAVDVEATGLWVRQLTKKTHESQTTSLGPGTTVTVVAVGLVAVAAQRVVSAAVGYYVTCLVLALLAIVGLALCRHRAVWLTWLRMLWMLPPCEIEAVPQRGSQTPSAPSDAEAAPRLNRLEARHARHRLDLWQHVFVGSESADSGRRSLLLAQQGEWWALKFLPLFFGRAHFQPDTALVQSRVAVDTDSASTHTSCCYYIPLSVYTALAVLYEAACGCPGKAQTSKPSTAVRCLWRAVNSLACVATLTHSADDPHTSGDAVVAPVAKDTEVLSHPLYATMSRDVMELMKNVSAKGDTLNSETEQAAFIVKLKSLFGFPSAFADDDGDLASLTKNPSCRGEPSVFSPFAPPARSAAAFVSDASSVEMRPFAYGRLWRRDHRECVAVFASALFLLTAPHDYCGEPSSYSSSIWDDDSRQERVLLLTAAVLLATAAPDATGLAGTVAEASGGWRVVQAAAAALTHLKQTLHACLARGEVLQACALVSPVGILSHCVPVNHEEMCL